MFYVAHDDGVANGYAENNRTKQVIRWKATGQHLSPEAKADLAAQAEQKRYARKQAEQDLYEATAKRLVEELRINNSGVKQTEYHKTKQIEVTPGAPSRNGDVLVPGYDVDGKLWTIQYIKEDGTKRFAKDSRKHGCFYVVGAPNGAAALQQIAMSPVVVIAEGYATAATLVKHGKVPTLAAYDHPSDGLGALQKRDVRVLLVRSYRSFPPVTPIWSASWYSWRAASGRLWRGPEWLSPEVVERVEHHLAIVSQNREGNSALVRS